ncbi:MAG: hypothetical protein PVI90_00450 [Desulfobacteraceae bacterium]|jgi:hypothetical protein
MSITYTLIGTENLGNNQTRTLQAYNKTSGVAFNVYVELTISAPYQSDTKQRLVDEEIYIPGITVGDLSGASFTTEDIVVLDAGQKRLIRQIAIGGGYITSIVTTLDFKEGETDRTIVKSEKLYFQGS